MAQKKGRQTHIGLPFLIFESKLLETFARIRRIQITRLQPARNAHLLDVNCVSSSALPCSLTSRYPTILAKTST